MHFVVSFLFLCVGVHVCMCIHVRNECIFKDYFDDYCIKGNFVSLYFHEFREFCSVAKVLPCHTFYVAHMDHLRNIFCEIIDITIFVKI